MGANLSHPSSLMRFSLSSSLFLRMSSRRSRSLRMVSGSRSSSASFFLGCLGADRYSFTGPSSLLSLSSSEPDSSESSSLALLADAFGAAGLAAGFGFSSPSSSSSSSLSLGGSMPAVAACPPSPRFAGVYSSSESDSGSPGPFLGAFLKYLPPLDLPIVVALCS
eukprot:CAMPEP_0202867418 /NCGR_PEP_ID=MMETSP1391-20130828/9395_1 /ASSEMBLY_ACC=CAM_ASM_000867 /TAXON_ID=1034604 /ORGANISM="Chlamydomonas leiostraca, Strain SAG 11-49" /LENGTH=164 /DNA_ID=CAMNT_0049547465 /DNA_START=1015 /DNA_END=1505 /DNA_ORIENTATION=-